MLLSLSYTIAASVLGGDASSRAGARGLSSAIRCDDCLTIAHCGMNIR